MTISIWTEHCYHCVHVHALTSQNILKPGPHQRLTKPTSCNESATHCDCSHCTIHCDSDSTICSSQLQWVDDRRQQSPCAARVSHTKRFFITGQSQSMASVGEGRALKAHSSWAIYIHQNYSKPILLSFTMVSYSDACKIINLHVHAWLFTAWTSRHHIWSVMTLKISHYYPWINYIIRQ